MSFTIDSNAPYSTEFPVNSARDAVYMTAEDPVLSSVLAVVYRARRGVPKLSVILLGAHGTSGYVDMTLDRASRYYGAVRGLAPAHKESPVRRALAIAALRTYATMDRPLRNQLQGSYDESIAGSLGSRFRLLHGKHPGAIGARLLEAGLIAPKSIETSVVDVVYEDSDSTIDQNNELVYLLGEQLEQLFDPLSEYSPEPTEKVYVPPVDVVSSLETETKVVQDICEELYLLQAHARSDILDLLQTTLIPLRVEVLKGRFPGITIARLNTVFPPTIDELFRVNNLFYEALRSALPLGAFEIMRACGTMIPYFFRACMRHEAATQKFHASLHELLAEAPDIGDYLQTNQATIDSVVQISLHLTKVKLVLDRLARTKEWDLAQKPQVDEFHAVASGTIDAFGKTTDLSESGYDRRVFTSTGKLLGEIASDWPSELEYGWINRRVVTIFDAVDILEPNESLKQLHVVFIVFTDALVVCQPSEPIPATSLSGLHVPSVGDMLMHAMLNEAPLDRNIPPLKVIAWAPILDVHFASYTDKRHLYVWSPQLAGSYQLVEPDSDAPQLVALLAKAKIITKTQPFHLFKVEGPQTTLYSTVQELQGYREEVNRTSVALFLNTPVTDDTLAKFDLVGAVSLFLQENNHEELVHVDIRSHLGYKASYEVPKPELRALVVSEIAYLLTLSISSQNQHALDPIIAANNDATKRLIKWAAKPSGQRTAGHKRSVGLGISHARDAPFVVPKDTNNGDSSKGLRKLPGTIESTARDTTRRSSSEENVLKEAPSMESEEFHSSRSVVTDSVSDARDSEEEAEQRDVDRWFHELSSGRRDDASLSSTTMSMNETGPVAASSNSSAPQNPPSHSVTNSESIQIGAFLDRSTSILYNDNAGRAFPRLQEHHSRSQSDGYESATESQSSGQVHYRLRGDTMTSIGSATSLENSLGSSAEGDSYVSGNTTIDAGNEEDFSYLASLVDATSFGSKLSELERGGVYPDLRESSLVRLGSYIVRNDKSRWSLAASKPSDQSLSAEVKVSDEIPPPPPLKMDLGSEEATPKLGGTNFLPFVDLEEPEASTSRSEHGVEENHTVNVTGRENRRSVQAFDQDKRISSVVESDVSLNDGNDDTLAEDWLAWTASSRPVSMMSISSSNHGDLSGLRGLTFHKKDAISESKSQSSFRRIVMSSSLHSLQLASFNVQLDQKAAISSSSNLKADLERVKKDVTLIFRVAKTTTGLERVIRQRLFGLVALLLSYGLNQLATGLLEVEWVRRTRIIELQPDLSRILWAYND